MAESTDTSVLSEKGKKTKRNPSPEHEEKQNSSPTMTLTPAVASRHEPSGETTVEPPGEGNITISPSKKRSCTTQDHDQTSIDATSESKVDSKSRQAASDFVKILTHSDVSSNQLFIPRKDWDLFPALETTNEGTSKWKQIYCFDDPKDRNKKLPMSFGRNGVKRVIGKGWTKFVKEHGLQENDTVRFRKHNVQPQEGNFNFLLSFERATPLPKVLRIKWRNRDDSSNKDKYDRYEDDNTVGGSVEQDDDEDDRKVGDNIEQGDDEDDNTVGDGKKPNFQRIPTFTETRNMSESTDTSDLGEKGKKTKRNPSAEREEKQNSSPPTTLTPAVASRKELSGKTTVEPRGEGNITISPSKKRSLTTQDYDQTSIDSTSESKVDSKARQAASDFVKILTRSDVSSNRLHIPRQDWDHFPALEIPNEGTSKWKQIYCFDDPKDENKKLPMSFGRKGNKRVIGKGWTKFVKEHGLQENDTVHFHRHNVQPQEGNFNFLLSFERATPLPKVLSIKWRNRDDSSNKYNREDDDNTVGGSVEQDDDEDDRKVGDNTEQGGDEDDNKAGDSIEQGDDEDDRTAGDGSEPSDDSADRGSNE